MESDPIDPRAVAAAANNAAWCDSMCRAHGTVGTFGAKAWTSTIRTPPLYPDAVTLDPAADERQVLGLIDTSAGCSIKDSFATLDLTPFGFGVLFDAAWIWRTDAAAQPAPPSAPVWARVGDARTLDAWQRAWTRGTGTGGSGTRGTGESDLFVPGLLGDPSLTIVGGVVDGAIVAGAVLAETDDAVGISNVFTSGAIAAGIGTNVGIAWAGIIEWAAHRFPGRALVGYESDADLGPAVEAGFTAVGPLRVWVIRTEPTRGFRRGHT